MAKAILTVEEVLKEITASNDDGSAALAKFSKEKFNMLMRAMINDPDFTTKKAITKAGALDEVTDIAVTKGFRKFCQKILKKFNVDDSESEKIFSKDFSVDDVDGLYDFFATALYEYINAGNKFDLVPKEDFKGSVYLKEKGKNTKTADVYHPKTREKLGTYTTTTEKHKVLGIKSSCPKYLKKRIKK